MKLEGTGIFRSEVIGKQEVPDAVERFLDTKQPFMDEREQMQDNQARTGQFLGRLVEALRVNGQLTDDQVVGLFGGEFIKAGPNFLLSIADNIVTFIRAPTDTVANLHKQLSNADDVLFECETVDEALRKLWDEFDDLANEEIKYIETEVRSWAGRSDKGLVLTWKDGNPVFTYATL